MVIRDFFFVSLVELLMSKKSFAWRQQITKCFKSLQKMALVKIGSSPLVNEHLKAILLSMVHLILKKHLKVRKISARWVLHLLTDEQKRHRVKVAKKTASTVSKI